MYIYSLIRFLPSIPINIQVFKILLKVISNSYLSIFVSVVDKYF